MRQGSTQRALETAQRKEVWERGRGEGKSWGSAVGPSERGWRLPLQMSRRAGRLLPNICINRAESQSSPGAVGLQQSRGRAGLVLQVCTVQCFGVQPAGTAERGWEVSAFPGRAGPARTAHVLPLAREGRRCSPERNCKSLPSAFPFLQRNSCGANIWMLVLIIEISGEGQGMICTNAHPKHSSICGHPTSVPLVPPGRAAPRAPLLPSKCRLMEKYRHRAKSKVAGKMLHV